MPVAPREGRGVGAVEAPRGILYHDYEYSEEGPYLVPPVPRAPYVDRPNITRLFVGVDHVR